MSPHVTKLTLNSQDLLDIGVGVITPSTTLTETNESQEEVVKKFYYNYIDKVHVNDRTNSTYKGVLNKLENLKSFQLKHIVYIAQKNQKKMNLRNFLKFLEWYYIVLLKKNTDLSQDQEHTVDLKPKTEKKFISKLFSPDNVDHEKVGLTGVFADSIAQATYKDATEIVGIHKKYWDDTETDQSKARQDFVQKEQTKKSILGKHKLERDELLDILREYDDFTNKRNIEFNFNSFYKKPKSKSSVTFKVVLGKDEIL